jgi:hypothetical protein
MRMIPHPAGPKSTGPTPGQTPLARLYPSGGIGAKRALWSMIHLFGAGVFLIAMLARMAQADIAPSFAPAFGAAGPAMFPNQERLLPSAPNLN